MTSNSSSYDFVVIGAGIFGMYAALFLQRRGLRVLLVERETRPWQKASAVNQARLHFGYHYPRSIATAILADGHRVRFIEEHGAHINSRFTQYYAIDRFNSLTSAEQFVRFCARIGIPVQHSSREDLFNSDRLEAVFETVEYSFDPYGLRRYYVDQLREGGVTSWFGETIEEAQDEGALWRLRMRSEARGTHTVKVRGVINAAYANLNAVNRLFRIPELDVVYELCEIVLFKSNVLRELGITVIDGPYVSVMPYGLSGLHSLSSVLYTPHFVCVQNDPQFSCQSRRLDCVPGSVRVCTTCTARPTSNARKMRSQLALYVRPDIEMFECGSLFTVKTKLKSSFVDDARPTHVGLLRDSPVFFTLFSGKINSIYEVERVLDHV